MKTAIITGITGQDGAYLAKLLLEKNYKVIGFTRANDDLKKLKRLEILNGVVLVQCALLDVLTIMDWINVWEPDEIYNLAAQSSVGESFSMPLETVCFNTVSVLNLLHAIKTIDPAIKFFQASSSEMYGQSHSLPITEHTRMNPISPYGVSKAAAHMAVVQHRNSYNMFACGGICFNHESTLRDDNFFIKKVISESIRIKNGEQNYLRVGNIDIKRDFGHAPKYVEAMHLMLQQNKPQDFIICSGQSISLRGIIYYVFDKLSIDFNKLVTDRTLFRPNEVLDSYGDNSRTKTILGWSYDLKFTDVLDQLIEEEHLKPEDIWQ